MSEGVGNNGNLIPVKPGEVRNPKGRPVGALSRSTIARKWLETKSADGLLNVDKVFLALLEKAMSGDVSAAKEMLDSGYGKLTDKQEVTGKDGADINAGIQVTFVAPKKHD